MKDDEIGLAKTVGIELALAGTVAADGDTSATPAPATPEVPGERFHLGREIGRGGMGRVLEATDRQFRRTVAVKEMLSVGDPHAKRRFLTEALVTGNLEHPGIPAVYERGDRADGSSYYAMRLVSGRTLEEALDEARSLDERVRLLPAVVKVAETVAYAHDRGVVHRDLKPQNVLLGRHGEVFLLDWGIAKVRGLTSTDPTGGDVSDGVNTQVGSVMGSPMYMAPEQARGDTDAIDERTDVFALGTMLYHVLTGRAPYQGKTVRDLAAQAVEARPPAVTDLVPGVNPELSAICAKAMQRDPAERHRSALELAAALQSFQSHAAQRAPSRLLAGVLTTSLGAVVLMAALFLAVGVASFYVMLVVHHGNLSYVSLFSTIVAFALAAVEYRTRGRAKLVGVGLVVAFVTFCVVLSQAALGIIKTMGALQAPELALDVPKLLQLGAMGVGEAMWCVFGTVPLALAQLIAWALLARRNALLPEPERA
jgi:hypothetical protein